MIFDKNIKADQLMTKAVVTVQPDDNLLSVEEIFKTNDFHHIVVIDKHKKVLGMISRSDFYKVQDSFTIFNTIKANQYNTSIFKSILASEIMAKHLAKLTPEDTIMVAVRLFRGNLFHALPIVDKDEKLLGILTTYDLLAYAYHEA